MLINATVVASRFDLMRYVLGRDQSVQAIRWESAVGHAGDAAVFRWIGSDARFLWLRGRLADNWNGDWRIKAQRKLGLFWRRHDSHICIA